jgi:hypothetical protein
MSKNNDSDSDISIEELDEEINESKAQLRSYDNPQTIESDATLDPKMIEDLYEKMKKMPMDKLTNLLTNLGKNHKDLGENHQFIDTSEKTQKSAKQRIKEKIAYLNMKRKSKVVIKQEEYKKQEIIKDLSKVVLQKVDKNVDENVDENVDKKPKVLSKLQKKRQKEKLRKIKKVSELDMLNKI